MKVTIYSTAACTHCKLAKDFFNKHNIKYDEFDVGNDLEKRQEMIEKSDQMGVPVIQVGNEIIVGFNKTLLSELLKIKV
ncbi:MAG: glutaredoxin-like protein [Parcubacteria group bacterium Gr01-1014_73]|nr:MAG: glutaredoxin-like protein [Parcubacteria group bacterium Gr01-1014_73]